MFTGFAAFNCGGGVSVGLLLLLICVFLLYGWVLRFGGLWDRL